MLLHSCIFEYPWSASIKDVHFIVWCTSAHQAICDSICLDLRLERLPMHLSYTLHSMVQQTTHCKYACTLYSTYRHIE